MADGLTYRIRVQLARTRPPVWRRVEVPSSLTLDQLHTVVHVAMGWPGTDGHEFCVGRSIRDPWRQAFWSAEVAERQAARDAEVLQQIREAGGTWAREGAEPPVLESEVRVDEVLTSPGDTMLYRYGIAWEHRLRLERTSPGEVTRPRCLAGRRAAPANYLLNAGNHTALVATAYAVAAGEADGDAERRLAQHFPGLSPAEVVQTVETFDVVQADTMLAGLARAGRL